MRALLAALAVCAFIAALAAGALYLGVYGDRSHPQTTAQVVVERGATLDEIAAQLVSQGVISNALTFRALAKLRGQDVAVRAGEYRFTPRMTQSEVLQALVTGGAQVATWVTIPEGFTAAQIAQRLESAGLGDGAAFRDDFLRESLNVDGAHTKGLEGFLFPSTYLVPLGAAPSQVAAIFTAQFVKELPRDAAARAKRLHVTLPQAVAVASLVEREAKSEVDRPQIAAVIYNRLRANMPLQVDATIEYALPEHKSALSFSDLRIDSPYNSYEHTGLPPTPIANPGRPSLEAAFSPAKSDNLYYVYCGNRRHVFAKTLAEHQANVARCLQ